MIPLCRMSLASGSSTRSYLVAPGRSSLITFRAIIAHRTRFCPHYLGAGIGLLASAHLLAAVGGDGILEVDANPNPLRTQTCGPLARVVDGVATLTDDPGLGFAPDLQALREFAVAD